MKPQVNAVCSEGFSHTHILAELSITLVYTYSSVDTLLVLSQKLGYTLKTFKQTLASKMVPHKTRGIQTLARKRSIGEIITETQAA